MDRGDNVWKEIAEEEEIEQKGREKAERRETAGRRETEQVKRDRMGG